MEKKWTSKAVKQDLKDWKISLRFLSVGRILAIAFSIFELILNLPLKSTNLI